MKQFKWMTILKTGTFTDKNGTVVTVDEEALDKIVNNFSETDKVNLVIEHPKFDKIGHGIIKALKRVGNYLLAMPDKVNEDFKNAVNNGELNGRSCSITSDWKLKHLGFLPKDVKPAVPDLGDYQFSEHFNNEELYEFKEMEVSQWTFESISKLFRTIKNLLIEKFSQIEADNAIPEWLIDEVKIPPKVLERDTTVKLFSKNDIGEAPMTEEEKKELVKLQAEKAKLEADLKAKDIELQAEQTRRTETETAQKKKEFMEFCSSENTAEKIKPADKEKVVALLMSVDEKKNIELSQPDGKKESVDLVEVVKALILNQPKVIEFSELTKTNTADLSAQNSERKVGQTIADFANK